ncbi:hypothetical protein [Streptomyces sp. NBC_00328]|uniref:hypothetical protein n=1 Tax=Streptomyces sp. NBC_00328 TaxID=2903646 RepID=UPI002E2BF216|nr:hypothetical protein [Streptomyces sp. NBC_00328]
MRSVKMLVTLGLVAAAAVGCGDDRAPADNRAGNVDTAERARRVATAWEGSEAARVWRQGYYPLGDSVQLPDGAFHDDADKRAYATQNFRLRAPLPDTAKKQAKVRWRDGDSLTLPLASAREAYDKLARGSNSGPALTVTAARLGRMTVPTSRGTATVPAWLFTVKGYDTPLKRVAVTPSELPRSPIGPVPERTDELGPLVGLDTVARDGRTITLRAEHGACDDGPAVEVLEAEGGVVFSASIRGTSDGPCTSELRVKKVTVKLRHPVGDRILLDAFTGRPIPPRQEPAGPTQ